MTAFVSFPQVLGHEVVGVVEQIGRDVTTHVVGDRVVLDPWLSCATRGFTEMCSSCKRGEPYLCQNFTEGILPPGIHTGNNRAITGGFGPYLVAHASQLHPIQESIPEEQAVLADPYAVSLHAVLKAPPKSGDLAVVYGCGTLGLLTIAILTEHFSGAEILAITRYPHQEEMARRFGAHYITRTQPPAKIIELVQEITGTKAYRPWGGLPVLLEGAQRIYDTVGTAQSLEVGVRLANPQAKIVVTGVASPKRFEWTPLYFKEIELIGSNAFGVETFKNSRQHAIDLALERISAGRLDLSAMITHRFPLSDYKQAFHALHNKEKSGAVKVVFVY
jgi:threonine dehydrogenase-like Zn-dependent dehydrogenase